MRRLWISPHLDDAVLSCGERIAETDHATVLTVFAGTPTSAVATGWDEACGFADSTEAMGRRRVEDQRACGQLGADVRHLDFLDAQYETHLDVAAFARLTGLLAVAIEEHDEVYAPVGIGHPDHELVCAATLDAVAALGRGLVLYEEVPYRVEQPVETFQRLKLLGVIDHLDEWCDVPARGDVGAKKRAVACYVSQLHGLDVDCLFVRERFWRIPA